MSRRAGLYATMAGYLLSRFGRLPSQGESIAADALQFEVVQMSARRIELVRIRRVVPAPVAVEEEIAGERRDR